MIIFFKLCIIYKIIAMQSIINLVSDITGINAFKPVLNPSDP
jgi:hypothetical protein